MIFRLAALGIGVLAWYYFDPASGKRRRERIRNRVRGRVRGAAAKTRRKLDIDLTQDLGR